MILTEMPRLQDPEFTRHFYQRWGRENFVIDARTDFAAYGPYRQCLSIKTTWSGAEEYYIGEATLAVRPDRYLVLNEGRVYGSLIEATAPVESFAVFFRPGMAAGMVDTLKRTTDSLLDDPEPRDHLAPEFIERFSPHDGLVTPGLRAIRDRVREGSCSEAWLEEKLQLLLERLLLREALFEPQIRTLPAVRASTRRELYRRLCRARDFIESCHAKPLDLARVAGVACLSPYHFLRLFRACFGVTPHRYLTDRRVDAAALAIREGADDLGAVADRVGFESRSTFYRSFKRRLGIAPSDYLRRARPGA